MSNLHPRSPHDARALRKGRVWEVMEKLGWAGLGRRALQRGARGAHGGHINRERKGRQKQAQPAAEKTDWAEEEE